MNIKGDYRMLFEIRADLHKQAQQSIVFRLLHQKEIAFFQEYNQVHLKRADTQDKAIVAKYVIHDKDGNPEVESIQNGMVHYRFTDAAAKENFAREYQDMLATKCTIGL